MKNARDFQKEVPKIIDVTVLEKLLEEEINNSNRKSVVSILEKRIDILTIKPVENNIEENKAEIIKTEEIIETEKPVTAIVLHQEKDILLILEPYKEKIKDFNLDDDKLKWKDTSDKVAYLNIKTNLQALSQLRRTIDAERTTFTEPYRDIVSLTNEKCGDFIGEIKSLETVLKQRKKDFDDAKAKEKQEKEIAKAAELEEKRLAKEQLEHKSKESSLERVKSNDFQHKFGGIIGRAKPVQNEPQADHIDSGQSNLFDTPENKIPVVLNDEQLLNKKISLLQEVLDLGSPDAEKFIKPCATIDTNVLKIINYIKNTFK